MADVPPTVDFATAKLDQVIEGYLCGLAVGVPDRDQLIDEDPSLAEELKAFLRDDHWMRRLAGSKPLDRRPGRRSMPTPRENSSSPNTSVDARGTSTFGDYDLLAEIGRGGMGVVYKARQRSLNRIVALKMIRSAQLASELEVQRFLTEAESAAHLDHPGIVPVYAAGEHEGRHYYSMAFVEGISLQELIADETVLPARDAAELVRRVAEAIQYAHRRGVIHRDLKPANILLAESDREDAMRLPGRRDLRVEPKVTDFGLAKKTEAGSELTGTGQILGTPSYMPPEQVAGQSGPLSDVYSLGAVLYCLLIGRPPFRAANAIQTLQQVMQDEPVPPRQVNSGVPRDLETVCLKCLQKSPGRRYGSAQELAADLKRFRDGEPITARPVSSWERASKWIRRHPATAGLAVVGLIMLMAFVGLVVSLQYRGERERLLYSRLVLSAHGAWRDNEIKNAQDLLKDCPLHLRGWEWGYVDRLCRTGLVMTIKPPNSNDGRHVAAGEGPGPVLVWDAANGHVIAVLEEATSQVTGVRFSPDGQQLETASLPFSRRWKLGERFSPDGQQLETASPNWTVRLWNLETERVTRKMTGHAGLFPRIAYSPDGSRVAGHLTPTFTHLYGDAELVGAMLSNGVVSSNSAITTQTWNAKELTDAVLKGHSANVDAVALSPDHQRLASAGDDGSIKLWDVTHCRFILDCEGHVGPVYDVAFSPDGHRLASGGNDRTVKLWDALTGRLILTLGEPDGHSRAVYGVAFHPDGGQVASLGADLAVKIWNVGSESEAAILRGHTGPAGSIAFHPEGALLASAGNDGVIKLWKLDTGTLVRDIQAHDERISALAFSLDGRLASASHDRTVKIWNVSTGDGGPVHILKGHKGIVYGVSFSPDGQLLASAGHDGKCIIWNVSTGQIHDKLQRPAGPVFSTVFDPRGSFIAVGGNDLTIRNLKHGVETLLTGHEREVFSVAFSPDGSRLVSGSRDGTVRVWSATTGSEIGKLSGHSAPVTSVVFSPAGDRIASTSWDGSVKIWDPESQQETLSLKGPSGRAYCVAFSPDGRYLASANHDGTITLWGR